MTINNRVLILGGTSDIAHHVARQLANDSHEFCLVARDRAQLTRIQQDLLGRGAAAVRVVVDDLSQTDDCQNRFASWRSAGAAFDAVIVAYGMLGDQVEAEQSIEQQDRLLQTNFVSAAAWLNLIGRDFEQRGTGNLVVIGSVAGDRARQSNFIYGSSKAALAFYTQGLELRLRERGVKVILVKPGQTITKMTEGMGQGIMWSSPQVVAKSIVRAMARGSRTTYTPWFWWPVMTLIRLLPYPIFRRLKI